MGLNFSDVKKPPKFVKIDTFEENREPAVDYQEQINQLREEVDNLTRMFRSYVSSTERSPERGTY